MGVGLLLVVSTSGPIVTVDCSFTPCILCVVREDRGQVVMVGGDMVLAQLRKEMR